MSQPQNPKGNEVRERLVEGQRHRLLVFLAAVFLTNALLAEIIGGKLFSVRTGLSLFGEENFEIVMSCGIVLWPVVFVMTDIINEYFGRSGVRRLSVLAAAMIGYAFVGLWVAGAVPAWSHSPVSQDSFNNVFRQSQFIIIGSITAFLIAQLVDVTVFWLIRSRTGGNRLWLRATGSTVVSQLVDTYVVGAIGLWLPHVLYEWRPELFDRTGLRFSDMLKAQTAGYMFKVMAAVAITPLLYLVHVAIDRWLGRNEAARIVEETAHREM